MCNIKYIKCLAVIAFFCALGCSKDNSIGPPPPVGNAAPTLSFTYGKLAAIRSTDVTLAVTVNDADGDPVTVTWQASRGLLTKNGQPYQIVWSTPSKPGTDTLTITASDGSASTVRTEVVMVGTRAADDITGVCQWPLANSPYIVTPATQKFSILPNASLTIQAGVRVLIDQAGSSIGVEGQLLGAGTPAQPIVIGPNTRTPSGGFWAGIVGTPPGSVLDFDYTWVTYAETAFKALTSPRLSLNGCTVKYCTESAIFHESGGDLFVENCVLVSNQKSAIRVQQSSVQLPDSIIVRGDSIAVNGRFSDSTDYTDGEAGISIDLDDVLATTWIVITDNEISRNDFPGIRLKRAVFPIIQNNGIFGNELRKVSGKVNVELLVPFAAGGVNATENWWGQDYAPADSAFIKQGIVDHDDNAQIGASVYVSPWRGSWP